MARCPHCKKKLTGNEMYCWYCEQDISDRRNKEEKPQCFIATAVYGEHAPETQFLRNFRDEKLHYNFFGIVFIDVYYVISPHLAFLISRHQSLKKLTKYFLNLLIGLLKKTFNSK